MKTEVLLRLLLERSIKEGSVSLSTAPNIQLWHNSVASFWNCHGAKVHWAGMGLGDKLPLDTLRKVPSVSLYCTSVSLPPCVALIETLCWRRAKEQVREMCLLQGTNIQKSKSFGCLQHAVFFCSSGWFEIRSQLFYRWKLFYSDMRMFVFFLSLGQLPFPVGGGKCQICSNYKIGRGQLVLFALTCQQTSGEHLRLKWVNSIVIEVWEGLSYNVTLSVLRWIWEHIFCLSVPYALLLVYGLFPCLLCIAKWAKILVFQCKMNHLKPLEAAQLQRENSWCL